MLILKFHIKHNNQRIYIESEAKSEDYVDSRYVYLKDGKIPKSMVEGDIEEEWQEERSEGGAGLDFLLPQ